MNIYLAIEETICETEKTANEMMYLLLRKYGEQQGIPVVNDVSNADVAIMLASRLQGKGFEAYHQVLSDWDVYTASYKLAAEMQTQVQRYQNLYKRAAKPGVVGCGCPHPPVISVNRHSTIFIPSSSCQTPSLTVHLCQTIVCHGMNILRRCSVLRGTIDKYVLCPY